MSEHSEHILVVDDEPRNLRIIQKALEKKYELDFAEDGESALEKIKDNTPAIILLDIMMPGIDGYEVCRKVREGLGNKLIKIILVSGKAMVEERLKGYEVGANDYVVKPFIKEELEAKVKVFLELYRAETKLLHINNSLEEEIVKRTDQLLKSEKMAFIGMHSAEIVHNLKNPLAIIKGYGQILQKKDPDNKYAPLIMSGVDKLELIIKSILETTRVNFDDEKQKVDINKIVKSELEVLNINLDYKHEVVTHLELNEVSTVIGSPGHFSQIFGNLFSNANDAMFECRKKELRIKTCEDEDFVKVLIADTGCGITEENLEKVFEPLFTTKSREKDEGGPVGTGLGLASCKRMIEGYGGTINIRSIVGEGTEFEVKISKHHK
jgi:signal transduction histidine kinase